MEKPGGDLERTQRIVPELYGLRVCLAYVTRPRGALGVVATRDGNQGPSPPQGGGVVHPPFPEHRRVWGMHGRPRLGPTRRRTRGVNSAGRITAHPAIGLSSETQGWGARVSARAPPEGPRLRRPNVGGKAPHTRGDPEGPFGAENGPRDGIRPPPRRPGVITPGQAIGEVSRKFPGKKVSKTSFRNKRERFYQR